MTVCGTKKIDIIVALISEALHLIFPNFGRRYDWLMLAGGRTAASSFLFSISR